MFKMRKAVFPCSTYYNVYFRDTKGKEHKLVQSGSGSWYEYLNVGDRVRYHGNNTNYYEKYDKSQSELIPCAGCGRSCDARAAYCSNCGTILFKANQPVTVQAQETPVVQFCRNCGTRVIQGAGFCENCGAKL